MDLFLTALLAYNHKTTVLIPITKPIPLLSGVREILECWLEGRPIRNEYLIVDNGKLAGVGAHSYSAGNVTGGSEEAVNFKKK